MKPYYIVKPEYVAMKNEHGISCLWLITYEFENMYEVVCERDKSRITHVGKDKITFWTRGDRSVDYSIGYCDRTIDMSSRNGNFAFTSLGLIVALEC
jgi:hypothetical protein